jgi:hypothetical protein
MLRKARSVIILGLFCAFMIGSLEAACECDDRSISKELKEDDFVVVAQAIDFRILENAEDIERRIDEGARQGKPVPRPAGNAQATFRILHSWKGKPKDPLKLVVNAWSPCQVMYTISPGDVFMLFIASDKGRWWPLSRCNTAKVSGRLDDRSNEITELNSITGKVYVPDPSVRTSQP